MKNKKFWNWVKNDVGESDVTDTPTTRTLYLNGRRCSKMNSNQEAAILKFGSIAPAATCAQIERC